MRASRNASEPQQPQAPCVPERDASQASICGQVRLIAPLPAIMPIWPPGIRSSSLSLLPIFDIMPSVCAGGTI